MLFRSISHFQVKYFDEDNEEVSVLFVDETAITFSYLLDRSLLLYYNTNAWDNKVLLSSNVKFVNLRYNVRYSVIMS